MDSALSQAVAKSPLFWELPVKSLALVAAAAQRCDYQDGGVIFHQGDDGDSLHVVLAGSVKVLVKTDAGSQAVVAILRPGDSVGELSLIDGEPRSATVEAIGPVETLMLPRQDFLAVVDQSPEIRSHLLATLAGRLRRTSDLAADLAFLDGRARLAKILLELADEHGQAVRGGTRIELPIGQADLAAMAGTTRESVNKFLRWFHAQGAIVRTGRRIVVVDPELLRRRIV